MWQVQRKTDMIQSAEDKKQRSGWTKSKKDEKVKRISQVLGCCDVRYEIARKRREIERPDERGVVARNDSHCQSTYPAAPQSDG